MKIKDQILPIVKQMDPTPEQERAVQSREERIAVTAGAGTGKTRTLVARFLALLAEGTPLRSIAAITFTKKAAREMRNRIRDEIRKYLSLFPDGQERQYWGKLYEELDGARISTIHSLAAEILRQHPAEMGLDPRFNLLDEDQSKRLKAEAVEAALGWAGEDPEVSRLFPAFGARKLKSMVADLLDKRLDVQAELCNQTEGLWEIWEPLLLEPIKEFIEESAVRKGMDELLQLDGDGTLLRAAEADDKLVDDLRIVIDAWKAIEGARLRNDWFEVSRHLGDLGAHLKLKGKTENWQPANPREIIRMLQEKYKESLDYGDLDLEIDRKLAREILPVLGQVFKYACDWYAASRANLNGLDFDDLEGEVLALFREYPEALLDWQGQLRHLLVDEYQDTNDRQRKLVNYLSGGKGSLFIVGDGKQSIYRFRGADVSVFREEQQHIKKIGEVWQLDTSYRAHPALLESLNYLLLPVLGAESNQSYREPFTALRPGREQPAALEQEAYIELHLVAGSKSEGAGRLAAEAIAARLLELIENSTERSGQSRLGYGDVAVLCRAASSFSDFEIAFEKAGIPYLTISGQGFYDRPEIRDVLNALQVFADPQDDLAAAGLMRSPVIGIADDLLLEVRDYQKSNTIPSLVQAAGLYAESIVEPGKSRLRYFQTLVTDFSTLAGRIPASELVSEYIKKVGYVAALLQAGQQRGAQNLKKLITDVQQSGIVNLNEFLNSVEELRSVAIREGEAPAVAEGAVQIMTVHQAKGLEFPIVVLGDATKRGPAPRNILLDERFGIVPPFSRTEVLEEQSGNPRIYTAKSLAYELALEEERPKEEAESDRILYVAATRAQEMLLISGVLGKPTKSGKMPKLGGWLGKLAGPLGLVGKEIVIAPGRGETHLIHPANSAIKARIAIYETGVEFTFGPEKLSIPEKREEKFSLPLFKKIDMLERSPQSVLDGDLQIYPAALNIGRVNAPARVIGKIVHRALELWKFPSTGENDFLRWVTAELSQAGYYAEEVHRDGYRRVRKLLEGFQESELYLRMEKANALWHEVPFSVPAGAGSYQRGTIDALFLEGDRWVLVEFKTDRIRDEKQYLAVWHEKDYQSQVAGYLEAAEMLLGQRPEPIMCFLNYKGKVRLETDRW